MGKPLVIEFVGLPGAGKTTVLHQVAPQLKAEKFSIAQRSEILQSWQKQSVLQKILKLIPQSQDQWSVLLHSLAFAAQVKPTNRQSFSKASRIFSNAKRLDAIRPDYQFVLLDQGVLQETWSVGITGTPPAPTALRQVLSTFVKSRSIAIVYFNIDAETALQRIQARSTASSRFDQMQSDVARSRLVQYQPLLEEIVSCSRSLGVPILEVDSTRPIEEKAEKITHWIINQA